MELVKMILQQSTQNSNPSLIELINRKKNTFFSTAEIVETVNKACSKFVLALMREENIVCPTKNQACDKRTDIEPEEYYVNMKQVLTNAEELYKCMCKEKEKGKQRHVKRNVLAVREVLAFWYLARRIGYDRTINK